jgi:hypothetical protein
MLGARHPHGVRSMGVTRRMPAEPEAQRDTANHAVSETALPNTHASPHALTARTAPTALTHRRHHRPRSA